MKLQKTKIHTDLLAAFVGVGILVAAPVLAKDHVEEGKCQHMRHHGGGMMLKHFDEIDADKNGKITKDELKAHHEARAAERKAEADTNGDGKISKDEFIAQSRAKAEKRAERMFGHMDQNGDGFISDDEKGKMHHGKGDHFSKMDTDGDGAITREELEAGKATMMERMKDHHGDKTDTKS